MRKWMRERMKRRPKPAEKDKGGESAQAPLQPAYFDGDVAASSPSREVQEPESQSPEPKAEGRHGDPESQPTPLQPPPGDANRRRRRRRGRGGRGRGGSGAQAVGSSGQTQVASPLKQNVPRAITIPQVPKAIGTVAPGTAATGARPKGVVILAIGLPGSGKSSWFKRHNITPLSSDLLRALLFDDATEQRFQDLVFSNLRSMLKARLIARRPINYVDATNLTPHERQSWIKLAKDYGYEVQAVFFDVPVEVCLERNQRRERVVAEDVMRRMAGKLRPPTFEEGFGKITVVRVKQKE